MKQCPQVGIRNTLLPKDLHVFVFFFCRGPNNRYFRLWDYTLCCDCSALPGCTKAATDKWAGCALIKFNLHKPVACGFPAVSVLFLAYSFLMEESLHPRQKSTSHRCLGLFWTLNSIPLVFISVFVPAPLFWLQQLWNQKVLVFHLFPFQYYLGYSESLQFSMNLRISFSISVKKKHHWNFDRDCTEPINNFGKYCLLDNVSLSTHEPGLSFSLIMSSFNSSSKVL